MSWDWKPSWVLSNCSLLKVNPRIKKLVDTFARHHVDAFLVTQDVNVSYLTYFPAAESWLLVGARRSLYITDGRYLLDAQQKLKGIRVLCYTKSRHAVLFAAACQQKIRRLGFDPHHITLAQYAALRQDCPSSIELIEAPRLVEHWREVKDDLEINKIRQALAIHKKAYQLAHKAIKPASTERDVLKSLEKFVQDNDVRFSFPPIVASGPNSCLPHAQVTARKIRSNDVVLLDMGIEVDGYKSDLTRMFFLGKIPPFVRQVNDCVAVAQRRAIENIRPGVTVAELDRAARNYLAQNRLAKYFTHSLGHGVGLEIHESPRLSQASKDVLREGMVITIEPAAYIPHHFGVRIEDMVLVTAKGGEVLSDDIH